MAFLDNLDVATKTTLSTTFLHEAAASLNQHPKMLLIQSNDKLKKLPSWDTEVNLFHLSNKITMTTCKKPVSPIQLEENALLKDKK